MILSGSTAICLLAAGYVIAHSAVLKAVDEFVRVRVFSRIYGHFQQHLYCACAETVMYELPV